jgi:membrane-associated phospholipid phosphatase
MKTLDIPRVRLPYLWITLSLALVVALGIGGAQNPGARASQIDFLVWLSGHGNAALDLLAQWVELFLSPPFAIAITTVVALVVGFTSRSWLRGVGIALAVIAAWLPTGVLKYVFDQPRPDENALAHILVPVQHDSSFPSGHVSFAIGLAYAAYLLFGRGSRRAARWVVSIGIVFVIVVAYSRLYVGVHYPSDVIASVFTSIAGILIFNLVWDAVQRGVVSRRKS